MMNNSNWHMWTGTWTDWFAIVVMGLVIIAAIVIVIRSRSNDAESNEADELLEGQDARGA
ncbi:hypothetical protein FRC98_09680 [Lujinxingia vulgaris]|uniref:Uncharacterized protein n=1 Tax=Lujinxingia vulgaris TaxID=2600176 RepID=A0A5C6XIA4_9DELT|nr:hypothetical protein [Lujinxingia vulgaris]TXD37002.1 hypothetical protein FRC98_09680 [Lujinxingia vulgaris]